ncbi:MAG: stage II sporulation protein P, partial [Oscillospiraceae bacterium]
KLFYDNISPTNNNKETIKINQNKILSYIDPSSFQKATQTVNLSDKSFNITPLQLDESDFGGKIINETFASSGNEPKYIKINKGYIKNTTNFSLDEIKTEIKNPIDFKTNSTSDQPQVLIFHTHATESFDLYDCGNNKKGSNSRSTDNSINMVKVGDAICEQLDAAGIKYIHDTNQYDHPSYNGAYKRSNASVTDYLSKYPSIKIVLDIHRDGIYANDNDWIKPVTEIQGKKAAQLMIITGGDDGSLNNPDWRYNLRFAAALQDQIESDYPTLTRPILFAYRNYNQQVSHGAVLIEIGSHGNFLGEVVYTGQLLGKSLSTLIKKLA